MVLMPKDLVSTRNCQVIRRQPPRLFVQRTQSKLLSKEFGVRSFILDCSLKDRSYWPDFSKVASWRQDLFYQATYERLVSVRGDFRAQKSMLNKI